MKAAIVTEAGRLPIYADFEEPVAGAGERIVSVRAAALAPLVRARASGSHYSSSGRFPFVVGVDGVGTLDDGQRVYFFLPRAPFGAMAERTVVPVARQIPVPDGLDDVTAAAIANPGMSSWAAFTRRAHLKPGETVLINGATGASGQLAVRIARHLGAGKVIATGRNVDVLAALGADAVIPLDGDGDALEARFQAELAQGVDVVVDYLWGISAERLLIAAARVAKEGVPLRFVQVGTASGADITLPGAILRSSAIELMGSGIGSVSLDGLLASIAGVFDAALPAGLTLPTDPVPLSGVEAAWPRDDGRRIVFTA
ncbi:MAG: zinc-binding alcohol dehydrogenase family protein [Sphingomonas sp.]|nr:zinc-binding alcohol dehydrogenase family protein [Sphingomonas sp.]MDX3884635.1 zinc-binding alcohol dehydrogenase family protein [Sphingomonas sp.]